MQAIRLVNTKNLEHDAWLAYRQQGIGGSDVAALCGLSRYKSPVTVYLDKIGELPPVQDNPKMKAGRMLEEVIANWFAEETGIKVWRQNAIFQHPEHKFMLANIDRWVPGQNAGLEVKNTGEYSKDDWAGTQAPTEYILQCNHYMAVTGADRWYIAVLIGGWNFQWRVIERDEALITNLITIEETFWNENVLAKVLPPYSHQDSDYLNESFPQSKADNATHLPEEAYPIMQALYAARADEKDAKRRKDTATNQIKGYMEDASTAYFQGELKFTWKTNAKSRPFKVVGSDD